jgi:phosphonoacetate hydrolase
LDDAVRLVGRVCPNVYSADASLYVLEAGAALMEQGRADFLYLSLTDYMQHKFAPDEVPALDFYQQMDAQIGRMLRLGAVVAATADHGMNAKNREDGTPNIIYVQSELAARFSFHCRVICPITDPYVVHHGALGSLVMVHVSQRSAIGKVRDFLLDLPGVTEVYERGEACRKLELAADRIGDLVVMSGRNVVLGRCPEDHDLSVLDGRLRSHGGRYEEMVPLLLSERLGPTYRTKSQCDPRNFDVFDFACHASS